jgi:hypothetical protein
MPQICDMGQTALLLLWRKACWRFFAHIYIYILIENPQSYVVDYSNTDSFIRNDVSRGKLFNKYSEGGCRPSNLTEKKVLYLKIYKNKWQFKKRHFLLNHMRVIWIVVSSVQQQKRPCTIPWRWLGINVYWTLATQRPVLLLQNLLIANKQPHNSLSSCCCSMLVSRDVFRHLQRPYAPQSKPKPSRPSH